MGRTPQHWTLYLKSFQLSFPKMGESVDDPDEVVMLEVGTKTLPAGQ